MQGVLRTDRAPKPLEDEREVALRISSRDQAAPRPTGQGCRRPLLAHRHGRRAAHGVKPKTQRRASPLPSLRPAKGVGRDAICYLELRDACFETRFDPRALLDRTVTVGCFASREPFRNAVGVAEHGEHAINGRRETVDRGIAHRAHEWKAPRGRLGYLR